jgi:pyridoxal phosphate enzyme (YggS family)
MEAADRLLSFKNQVPEHIKIVAVTKNQPVRIIESLYHAGHRCFGENKVQELLSKYRALPGDIEWHFIGHLQRNKVKQIVPFIAMIQSIDSFRLLLEVHQEAQRCNRSIPCLLQFHIATETTKYGLDWNEAVDLLNSVRSSPLSSIRICGVMGMATLTEDPSIIAHEFRSLVSIFTMIRETYFQGDPGFREISMGMSGDYSLALELGSTILRIGSLFFRNGNSHK